MISALKQAVCNCDMSQGINSVRHGILSQTTRQKEKSTLVVEEALKILGKMHYKVVGVGAFNLIRRRL